MGPGAIETVPNLCGGFFGFWGGVNVDARLGDGGQALR